MDKYEVCGLDGVDTPQTVMTKRAHAVQTTATTAATTTTKTITMNIKRLYPPSTLGLRLPADHQSAPQPG